MTITTSPTRDEYQASAGQDVFTYTFRIFTETDLNVYVTPAGQECDDQSDLVIPSAVTGVGDPNGGTVTIPTPANDGDLVTIVSDIPAERTTDYQNNGDFRPETVNEDFDRVVSLVKQVEELSNRTLVSKECQQGPKPLSLPAPQPGFLMRWNGDSSGMENVQSADLDGVDFLAQELVKVFPTVAAMQADLTLQPGQSARTQENTTGNGGGADYLIAASQVVDGFGDHALDNGNVALIQDETGLIEKYGAVSDGSTDDGDSILSAAAHTGIALINNNSACRRLPWVSGVIRGSGTVVNLDWPSIDAAPVSVADDLPNDPSIKMCYVHAVFSPIEFMQIKALGFNSVVHYRQYGAFGGNNTNVMAAANAVGINIIFDYQDGADPDITVEDANPAVIGYYLFDEPQSNAEDRAAQETRITLFRGKTDKFLCIADNGLYGFSNDTLSPLWDIIFVDSYYVAASSDDTNKLNAIISHAEIGYKCPQSKLIPVAGFFEDASQFTNRQKQISFGTQQRGWSDNDFAVFSWDSTRSDPNVEGMTEYADLRKAAADSLRGGSVKSKLFELQWMIFENNFVSGSADLNNYYRPGIPAAPEPDSNNDNIQPFSVKNVGSAIDERRSTFNANGIGFKDEGGVFASSFKAKGSLIFRIGYANFVDAETAQYKIINTTDDFFTRTDLYTSPALSNGQAEINIIDISTQPSSADVGIEAITANSSSLRWKFFNGYLITCSWIESTF